MSTLAVKESLDVQYLILKKNERETIETTSYELVLKSLPGGLVGSQISKAWILWAIFKPC